MANFKDEEMSMEDILSSIRKYVSEEDGGNANLRSVEHPGTQSVSHNNDSSTDTDDDVITLGQEDVAGTSTSDVLTGVASVEPAKEHFVENSFAGNGVKNSWNNETPRNSNSPFNKLAEALKTYGRHKKNSALSLDMSVEQFFCSVVETYLQKWMDANLNKMVEEIIRREIDRLKSE